MSAYEVSCSFCGAKNRVPAEKEGKSGRCGKCHKELPQMYYRPQQLTERTFDAFINGYERLVLAEFWAPWCPHCVSFAPTVRKVAELLAGDAAVVQINTQENPSLAQRFGVSSIPVLVLLRQGKVADRLPGAQSSEAIISWFRRHK
jgi:thioredoxin 2